MQKQLDGSFYSMTNEVLDDIQGSGVNLSDSSVSFVIEAATTVHCILVALQEESPLIGNPVTVLDLYSKILIQLCKKDFLRLIEEDLKKIDRIKKRVDRTDAFIQASRASKKTADAIKKLFVDHGFTFSEDDRVSVKGSREDYSFLAKLGNDQSLNIE